jgi:hypothetical protein
VRQGVAAVALVVVVVLIAVGVHGCQASATESALKDYTNQVSSIITQSNQTGSQLFGVLSSGGGAGNATTIQTQINAVLGRARNELSTARSMSIPDQVQSANANFLLALRMRLEGVTNIANDIQPALGNSASQTAVNQIAAEMARFYASDVVYKDYAATGIAAALHANSIAVGGPNGESIAPGQFVPNVQWLIPSFIASELHVSLPAAKGGKVAPGLHGHVLNSVSVNGTTLQTGSTNTIPTSPAPVFTLNFQNDGQNNESGVVCKVAITGTNVSGQTTVPETVAGQNATCKVTLNSTPTAGTHTIVATIEKVPGEHNIANNTQSFPVTFQ